MNIESKRKLKFKKNLYKLSLISFVVVLVWIGAEILWSYTRQETDNFTQVDLEDIDPNVYEEYADQLLTRRSISQTQLDQFRDNVSFTQTVVVEEDQEEISSIQPTPEPTPISSPIPTASPIASPSGQTLP